tara:strand:- start:4448 stop:5002 length:555 start_codon:yes stop_codon:yes gene_type:complete
MIRNIAVAAVLVVLAACQTTSYPPLTYKADAADKVMQAAYDVCVKNIGDAGKMQSDVKELTGDTAQSKRVRVEGRWQDIDHYRFYDKDVYLAFFSVYRNGKGCAVNFASGSVPKHIVTQRLSIEWVGGSYNHAQFGKVSSTEIGVEYIPRIEGEVVFDMVLFLDKEWTELEAERVGAPKMEWGG